MGGPFTPACSFLPSRSPMSSALITKLLVGRKKTLNPYLISTFPTPTFFYLSLYDHPNRLYYHCLCRQCHCQPPVSRPVLESIRSTVCTGYCTWNHMHSNHVHIQLQIQHGKDSWKPAFMQTLPVEYVLYTKMNIYACSLIP